MYYPKPPLARPYVLLNLKWWNSKGQPNNGLGWASTMSCTNAYTHCIHDAPLVFECKSISHVDHNFHMMHGKTYKHVPHRNIFIKEYNNVWNKTFFLGGPFHAFLSMKTTIIHDFLSLKTSFIHAFLSLKTSFIHYSIAIAIIRQFLLS